MGQSSGWHEVPLANSSVAVSSPGGEWLRNQTAAMPGLTGQLTRHWEGFSKGTGVQACRWWISRVLQVAACASGRRTMGRILT